MTTENPTLALIPEGNILYFSRQRKDITEEELQELANSIEQIGLLHLPLMRKVEDENGEIRIALVTGQRRIKAMLQLWNEGKEVKYLGITIPPYSIPFAPLTKLEELEAQEIELQENTKRVNLSWQDRARAVALLDELRKAQNPKWKDQDTAEEMFGTKAGSTYLVRQRVILAQNLDDPDIAKAKTEKEALKTLERKTQQQFRTALGKMYNMDKGKDMHKLIYGNCIEEMEDMEEESVDIILTDPPYGIGASNFGMETKWKHAYDDNFDAIKETLKSFCIQSYRVANSQSHMYSFCAFQHFPQLARWLSEAGWKVWPKPLIWYKNMGGIPDARHGPRYVYECIIYAVKGGREVNGLYDDVINVEAVNDKLGAAQKPVELYVNLLTRSAKPGDVVLDPFCGTGTIFPACNQTDTTAIGIDSDMEMIGVASERLNESMK